MCTLNIGVFLCLTKIDDDKSALAQNIGQHFPLPEGAAVLSLPTETEDTEVPKRPRPLLHK